MTRTGTVHTEGANIVYDYEGDGPLLLTIAGGGGDGSRYAPISHILANEYTIVSYDRRGNSRSTGDTSVDMDMAQSARDAAAVIRAMGVEKAYVFGNHFAYRTDTAAFTVVLRKVLQDLALERFPA